MRRSTTVIAAAALCAALTPMSPAAAESRSSTRDFGSIGPLDDFGLATVLAEGLGSADLPSEGFRIRDVRVQVNNVTHSNPSDIDLGLRIGGNGFSTVMMSDAGGEADNADANIANGNFLFDESGLFPDDLSPLTAGTRDTFDFETGENDNADEGGGVFAEFPLFNNSGFNHLDGEDPELLRGAWSIVARDDAINGESGFIGNTSVLIRLDRPDVDTLIATPNPALQGGPTTVTATATAFGDNCTINAATGYQFDLTGDGDFDDASEGPGANTRALGTSATGVREITVRATQSGVLCEATGAFRDKALNFGVGDVATCAGQVATHQGTDAPETIVGTAGPDVIAGLGGGDVILGLGGNDIVCGGDGGDLIKGDGGRDRLYGENGSDILKGGRDRDLCIGGLSVDRAKKCEKTGSI